MSREGALAPATVRIPDLSLLILETKDEGETLLSLRLTSANPALGYNLKLFGPTPCVRSFRVFPEPFHGYRTPANPEHRRQGQGRDQVVEHGREPLPRSHAR